MFSIITSTGQPFYRFPIGAFTNNEMNENNFVGIPANETWNLIRTQLNTSGFASGTFFPPIIYSYILVMMHPMEFSNELAGIKQNTVNATQILELRNLLTMVKNSGMKVVPIQRINLDAPTTPIKMVATTGAPTTASITTTTTTTTSKSTTSGVVATTTGTTGGTAPAGNCNCIAFRCNALNCYRN
jgi:hypothetical protein